MSIALNDQHIDRLRNSADPAEILKFLQLYTDFQLRLPSIIKNYHDLLIFLCAFPNNEKIYELADAELKRIAAVAKAVYDHPNSRKQNALMGSAIPHTELFCSYSRPLTQWMLSNFPGKVELGSSEASNETVREIMHLLLPRVEFEKVSQGELGLRARLKATGGLHHPAAQLEWLLQLFEESRLPEPVKDELYQQLKIFIHWKLDGDHFNRSFLRCPIEEIFYRKTFIKKPGSAKIVKQKIPKPVPLSLAGKRKLTGIMKASLAFQYKETDPVTYADENEVELFDMGRGLQIALQGMTKEKRLSLETYTGYMAFQNGIPVSYGGGWIWGRRCRIGVNIFPAFRRGESAWLFCQVLRVYYQHYGLRLFIVKPYQFGKGNPEGLKSGAFWFYYKLGFRPAEEGIRKEAALEWKNIKKDSRHRTSLKKLRHFTSCNKEWIVEEEPGPHSDAGKISAVITGMINRDFAGSRQKAISNLLRRMKKNLHTVQIKRKLPYQQQVLENWALLTGLIAGLPQWNRLQKKKLAELVQLKQSGKERDYIRHLQMHGGLWQALEHAISNRSPQKRDG